MAKKFVLTLCLPAIAVAAFAFPGVQAGSDTVEIKVWVQDKGQFVTGLTLDDFEIYEDGVLQTASTLRHIKGQAVVREEKSGQDALNLNRNFYLLFQTVDWDRRLGEAVDHLFQSLLLPGDTMTLVTPMQSYGLAPDALAKKPKSALSKEMQQILRKDIQQGGGDYRNTLRDLRRIVRAIGGDRHALDVDIGSGAGSGSGFGLEMQLDRYKQGLMSLENLRLLDQKKLLEFAENLRTKPGRNFVVFFYQREFRPEISSSALNTMLSTYQDAPNVLNDLQDLFQYYRRERVFDADLIRQAFADAAMTFHFIFMDKESMYIFGANMREQSEDILPLFSGIAAATGGASYISRNAAVSFQSAADSAREHYLLTYVPARPERDGGFRQIQVRVKDRDFVVSSRAGYYAR